jgi:hypothetical protein
MADRNLSPAAQAVFSAWAKPVDVDRSLVISGRALEHQARSALAAALRALAYNVYSDEYVTCGGSSYALMIDRDDILAIADELEAQ